MQKIQDFHRGNMDLGKKKKEKIRKKRNARIFSMAHCKGLRFF